MVKVEYSGECYGCPFCHSELIRSGLCKCGAEIHLTDLTAEAARDGEQMTRELAEKALAKAAKIIANVSRLVPLETGSARISYFVKGGRFYYVAAKK